MKLVEAFLKDELFIDFGAEVMYGDDQMCLDYPHRFATVGFQLMETSGLAQIADRIRKDQGFKPMHPMDEFTDDTCDNEGWYDFFVGLNEWSISKVDSSIDVIVVNSDSPDNEECYTIDLDGKEQEYVYARLDEQCRKYLGKSCEDLLAEARKAMEEDES